jgi:hypothetical protein
MERDMTVAELIKALQAYPPGLEVLKTDGGRITYDFYPIQGVHTIDQKTIIQPGKFDQLGKVAIL